MKNVHYIDNHLDILLEMNYITRTEKVNILLKARQKVKQQAIKTKFSCLFCNQDSQEWKFCLQYLNQFKLHLELSHNMFYELDLILSMQFVDEPIVTSFVDNIFIANPI